MFRSLRARPALAASILGSWFALASATAAPMPLAGHHATYKLTLLKGTGTKAPEAVEGLLSYDFSGSACDGYAMTLRQMTALQPQEGETHVSDMQTASFEGGDARDYRFKITTKGDAAGGEKVDGKAHRDGDGAVAVEIDQPQVERAELPNGVLFPTEHLKKIIATGNEGGRILSAQVFDGSETGKKVFNTLSVIGAATTSIPEEKPAQTDALKGIRRWPVTVSYFDAAKSDQPPDYILTFDLYENGISRALKLDYGDFVLGGELTALTLSPEASCHP